MSGLYIHLGPPKTATTSFQNFLLENEIKHFKYEGIAQPRIQHDESIGKELYRAVVNSPLIKYNESNLIECLRNMSTQTDIISLISEEMFLTTGKKIDWKRKLKNLKALLSDIDCKIIITVRNPINAIRSYYQELYFNLDEKYSHSINAFADSNYCSIYDYGQLIGALKEIGFKNLIVLKYDDLINLKYSMNDIFGIDCDDIIELSHSNKSTTKNQKYYAKNSSIKKVLSKKLPPYIKNVLPRRIKRPIASMTPDFKVKDSLQIDSHIKTDIKDKYLESFERVIASRYII